MKKRNRLNLNGIIVLDKPKGYSSNQLLQKVKRIFNAQKAGHTGTLDPMATGVLPICFGRATKISQYLLDADKEYEATIRLGVETDSGDAEGQIIKETAVVNLDKELVEKILEKYHGQVEQVPPMFSALKYNGQPLYKLAREGKTVEVKPRNVMIYQLDLLSFNNNEIKIKVRCSKGTYIRTLGMDIGKELGCGGHLSALRRTKSGPFSIQDAYSIGSLEDLDLEQKISIINKIEQVFVDKSIYKLAEKDKADFFEKGRMQANNDVNGIVRVYSDDKFVAIAEFEQGKLINRKFFG